jgi:hypothetical protein
MKNRGLTLIAAGLLGLAACTHLTHAEPNAVQGAQNDSPAISPWAQPPSNAGIEEGPASTEASSDP